MKNVLYVIALCSMLSSALAEERFGRPVVKVENSKNYDFVKNDDVKYPTLSDENLSVSCLVYRGTERYYVETRITNRAKHAIEVMPDFIVFDKPGYTVFRTDPLIAARENSEAASYAFVPSAAPYVPPSYRTTMNATATSYGSQTYVSGTATTTADNSGQAGANLGNAIGNAIAARRFRRDQQTAVAFSDFLVANGQRANLVTLQPGETRSIVSTFEQMKQKKKPFNVTLEVAGEKFAFRYKE